MIKHSHIILLAAAGILLYGCAKESTGDGGGLRMQVEPSVAKATKASLTASSLQDFYLRVASDDPAYSYFVHMSKDGSGAWVSPTQLLWKNASASVDYTAAYYGSYAFKEADFAPGASVALTLPADQSTQERLDAADLLMAPTVSKAYSETVGGALPVAFSHALAKICFNLTLGEDFYNNGYGIAENPVKDFTVQGMIGDFSFVPSTGEVTAGDTPVEITPLAGAFTPGTAGDKSANVTYEAIVVPKIVNPGKLKVTFSVGNYSYSWTSSFLLVLSSGQTYNLPISATTAPPATGGGVAIDAEAITLTPVADYCDVYLGQDIQPRTSQCIGIGATQVFSVSVSPSGASQEVSIKSSSGEASFSLSGNTLTVSAPPSATSSTPTVTNTSTVTLLGAGGYTQEFTFNITELDPYLAKSGDVITSEGHIGDGGNRGAGIFENPVFTVDKVNCMIAHVGEEHLTEDPLWSSYKPNPGITGFGNREVHGIAVPINITKLYRTSQTGGEYYYTDNGNDNYIEDSGNLPKWVKNNSEYKALLRSNSTKHSAFMNTCCHVYCNDGRGSSYEILPFNYFVEDATKQPSIDAGESRSLVPSNYVFCSSFSASGNGFNASSVNECSLLGPWVMPTIADFLSVFTDGLTASAVFNDVDYSNQNKVTSKVEVLLHTLSLFGYSNLTYNDTPWWLANETGQNQFVQGTIAGNGAYLSINKRVSHNSKRAFVLPIRYF